MSLKFLAQIVIALIGTIVMVGIAGHLLRRISTPTHQLSSQEITWENADQAACDLARLSYQCWKDHSYGRSEAEGPCKRLGPAILKEGTVREHNITDVLEDPKVNPYCDDISLPKGNTWCKCPKKTINCIWYPGLLGNDPWTGAAGTGAITAAIGAGIFIVGVAAGVFTFGWGTLAIFTLAGFAGGALFGGLTGADVIKIVPSKVPNSIYMRDFECNGCDESNACQLSLKPSDDLFRLVGQHLTPGEWRIEVNYKLFCGFKFLGKAHNPGYMCYGIEIDVRKPS